jgi:hypothetical protein
MSYIPKVGDKCKIKSLNSGAVFHDCKILYIDNLSIVFSSSACSSLPMRLIDIEFLPLKTPAEVEREKGVDELVEAIINFYGNPKGAESYKLLAEKLYVDLGYRKQQVKPLSESYALKVVGITRSDYWFLIKHGFIEQGGE